MPITRLELNHFRTYSAFSLRLDSGITVFTGKNGVGKTSVLESISLLGSGRSFRPSRNPDFIRNGEELALLKGEVENQGLHSDLELRIYPHVKKYFVDKKLAKSAKILQELLPTIVFSPADHRIIEGDSQDRKLFLNRAAAQVDWEYQEDLNHYAKALLQRNRVLKDSSNQNWNFHHLQDLLAPWDEQILLYGSRLIARRNFYLFDLKPWAKAEYRKISRSEDEFDFVYQPFGEEQETPLNTEGEIREFFAQKLKDSLRRDTYAGSTQVGPHKDEFLLTLNGNKVKFYGSQGEKRTCALALRLGELALFQHRAQRMPVLLFDDVSSELDSARRRSLVDLLRGENTQVLITATELPASLMGDVGKNFNQLDLNTLGERN